MALSFPRRGHQSGAGPWSRRHVPATSRRASEVWSVCRQQQRSRHRACHRFRRSRLPGHRPQVRLSCQTTALHGVRRGPAGHMGSDRDHTGHMGSDRGHTAADEEGGVGVRSLSHVRGGWTSHTRENALIVQQPQTPGYANQSKGVNFCQRRARAGCRAAEIQGDRK